MPWKETDVDRERISFVVEALNRREPMSVLCRRYGISRKTGYKWLKRFRQVGNLAQLRELSRRPHRSPRRTPERIEQWVERIRLSTGWGGRKISRILAREGVHLARSTVDQILRRRGLIGEVERHRPAVKRFERSRPNKLVQMDFKGQYRLRNGRECYPLSILDDHSRFVLGLYALGSQHGQNVKQCLVSCFELYGVPEAMLMDHGNPWWGTTNGHGLTQLSVFLIRQGIRLHYGGIGHPQTQGKVERFHRSLGRAIRYRGIPRSLGRFQALLEGLRYEYNEIRPHEALGDQVPRSRYQPSRKPYNARPRPWEYPPGAEVARVRDNGCLHLEGRYWFVCHALKGRRVWCQRFGRRILVTYRHMHVREIDVGAGRTTPVVRPATRPEV